MSAIGFAITGGVYTLAGDIGLTDARGRPWSPARTETVLAARELDAGGYAIVAQGLRGALSELTFDASGALVGRAVALTELDAIARESAYEVDLTGDGATGFATLGDRLDLPRADGPSVFAISGGAFGIVDDGTGDVTPLLTDRGAAWSLGRNDSVVGVREDGDGHVLMVRTTGRTGDSYAEYAVSADGAVARRGEAVDPADLFLKEVAYGRDFDGDGEVGFEVVAPAGAGDDVDDSVSLVRLSDGRLAVLDDGADELTIIATRHGPWQPPAGAELLGVRAEGTDYRIAYARDGGIFEIAVTRAATERGDLGGIGVFDGAVGARVTALSVFEVLAAETAYGQDLDGDGVIGAGAAIFDAASAVRLDGRTAALREAVETFAEIGDAGQTPATAQDVTTTAASIVITGGMPVGDVDLYRFEVFDGAAFSAAITTTNFFDPMFWLFDEAGVLVAANDDFVGLLPGFPAGRLTADQTGVFYLGVTPFSRRPVDSEGILLAIDGAPLASWTGSGGSTTVTGAYTLTITVAPASDAIPVPDPDFALFRLDSGVHAIRDGGASVLLADSRGGAWAPTAGEAVAVRKVGADYVVLVRNPDAVLNGEWTEQAFSATGAQIGPPQVISAELAAQREHLYGQDLSGDGATGDTVAARLDEGGLRAPEAGGVALHRSADGAFYASKQPLAEGAQIDGGQPDTFLLEAARALDVWTPARIATTAEVVAVRALPGDRLAVLIEGASVTGGRTLYSEQVFQLDSSGLDARMVAVGRERSLTLTQAEALFLTDLNGDQVIDMRGGDHVPPLTALTLPAGLTLRADFAQVDGVDVTGGEGARIELFGVTVGAVLDPFDVPYVFAEKGVYVVDPAAPDGETVVRTYADLSAAPVHVRPDDGRHIPQGEIDGTVWHVAAGEYGTGNAGATSFQVNLRSRDGDVEGYSDLTLRGANHLFEGASAQRGAETVLLIDVAGATFGAGEQLALGLNVEGFRFQGPATDDGAGFVNNGAPVAALSGLGIGSVVSNNVFANHRSAYNSGASDTEFVGNLVVDSQRGAVFGGKADGSVVGGRIADNVFENVGGGISVARSGVVIEGNVVSATDLVWQGAAQAGVGISLTQRNEAGVQFWLEGTKVLDNDLSGSVIGMTIQRGAQTPPVGGAVGLEVAGNSFGATPVLNLAADTFVFGANTVLGTDYDTMVVGGVLADTLSAGNTDDVLIGGAGVDVFAFASEVIGRNLITDFEGAGAPGGDVIDLRYYDGLGFDDLTITASGGNSEITAAAFDGSITVLGVTGLTEDDFNFLLV